MNLRGQVAIVTGAASGIGRATAHRLAKEGVDVVGADINLEGSNKVVDEIKEFAGDRAIAIKADVTNPAEVNQLVKSTLEKLGKIDILICNAGASVPEGSGPFENTTFEGLASTLDLNLKSVLICARAVVGHMIQRRSGRIVSTASHCAMIGCKGLVSYSAAKSGIYGFTKSLAKELGPYGITVNCVSPAAVATPRLLSMPERMEMVKEDVWLHRLGEPEEIADAITFLVSEEASFITGHNLAVDGGRSLGW